MPPTHTWVPGIVTIAALVLLGIAACDAPPRPPTPLTTPQPSIGPTPTDVTSAGEVPHPPTYTLPLTTTAEPEPGTDLIACEQLNCYVYVSQGKIIPIRSSDGLDRYRVLSVDPVQQDMKLGLLTARGGSVRATAELEPGDNLPVGEYAILLDYIQSNGQAAIQVCPLPADGGSDSCPPLS